MPSWFHASDFTIARLVIQRGLGIIYLLAFLVALEQFRPLLGERGLLPVTRFLAVRRFRDSPSLFHYRYSDRLLVVTAVCGILLSLAVVLGLPDHWPVALTIATWLVLWALYLSIVNVGQVFYAFGWESLLLEAGFLAAFLGPAWSAVPAPLIWLFRWLLFRVEFGAGLIKLRGDRCWRELTCLDYHHQTQPMPNALSWFFHRVPKPLHRLEVLGNHFAQLVAPVMLFLPRPLSTLAGAVMLLTQGYLVLSGNYAWLNVLTMCLTISAFDDRVLGHLLPLARGVGATVDWHDGLVLAITGLVVVLSYRPARNLLSRAQSMNASFDPFHLVNTYGAFGSVTKERHEVVLEGTAEEEVTPQTRWREYEFRGKPTAIDRRPRQWAPYHLRLDWLMWFAGLSRGYAQPWLLPLIEKLLENDRPTLRLLRGNPFPDRAPRAVRAVLYRYRFSTRGERRQTGAWWVRTRIGEYLPPMGLRASRPPGATTVD